MKKIVEIINKKEHICYKNNDTLIWKYKNKIHREDDKPAMENSSGVYYYKNGFLDRKNKPAIITETLTEYYKSGKLHRLGEPARIDTKKGIKEYWVNGKKLNIEEIEHQKTLKKISEF